MIAAPLGGTLLLVDRSRLVYASMVVKPCRRALYWAPVRGGRISERGMENVVDVLQQGRRDMNIVKTISQREAWCLVHLHFSIPYVDDMDICTIMGYRE